ncbi:putative L-xylulose reductase-like [Daphnia sinensis]|uniref:L-xylulose reductase-like n=1 Tax=Daphnia sinensis TaxID=1820382 RepID=A0AAD5PLX7_9CRUS|nr:putative L-xylulose reductase-like [Daphnia sinensis]
MLDPSEKEGKELLDLAKGKALQIPVRLFEAKDALDAINQTLKAYGRIDGLVNNAGVNDSIGLENGNPESFAHSVARNLHHYYQLAHYALPYLKKIQSSQHRQYPAARRLSQAKETPPDIPLPKVLNWL